MIKSSIKEKLDSPDFQADHQAAKAQRLDGSGNGLLLDNRFVDWSKGNDPGKHMLYLHGKPGAGK